MGSNETTHFTNCEIQQIIIPILKIDAAFARKKRVFNDFLD